MFYELLANLEGWTTLVLRVATFSGVGISGATERIGGIALVFP